MLYEIDIHRKVWNEEVDMKRIYADFTRMGVSFDKDERRSGHSPEEDEQPEYVYVEQKDLGRAVQIIASLGYETDEDDLLNENL